MGAAKTREQWLQQAARELRKDLKQKTGLTVPKVRISVGWPKGSHGAAKAIGQCWYTPAVADDLPAIFISPELDKPLRVLDVLLHELIHAAVGSGAGHRAAFSQPAAAVGLVKPWTATTAGPELTKRLRALARKLGKYDHAKVSDRGRKKQGTRMIKVECDHCGYLVRTTQRWLEEGWPMCPGGYEMTPER